MSDHCDSLKKQIDELNRLCDDMSEDAHLTRLDDDGDFVETNQSANDPEEIKRIRLGQLILRLQDDDLEPKFVRRLEQWLLADRFALNYYVEFSWLCAELHCLFNPGRFAGTLEAVK